MAYSKAVVRRGRAGRARVVYQDMGDSYSDCTATCDRTLQQGSVAYQSCIQDCSAPAGGSSSSDSGGGSSTLTSLAAGAGQVLASLFGPKPTAPQAAPQSGISTTTVVVAGAAVIGLALILRKRG